MPGSDESPGSAGAVLDGLVEPPAVYFIDTAGGTLRDRALENPIPILLTAGIVAVGFTGAIAVLWPNWLRYDTVAIVNLSIALVLLVTSGVLLLHPRVRAWRARSAEARQRIRAAPHSALPDWPLPFWIADWWRDHGKPGARARSAYFPPGAVVIVNMPELVAVRPVAQRFEPILIHAERARLQSLVEENRQRRPAVAGRMAEIEIRAAREAARRARWRRAQHFIVFAFPFAISAWRLQARGGLLLFAGAAVGLGLLLYLMRFVDLGRMLLIPGGLLVRVSPGGPPRYRRLLAPLHGLVMREKPYSRLLQLDVYSGAAMETFTLRAEAAAGFLAGWLSTAPPPTDEQLREFLGLAGNSPSSRAV